MKMVLNRRLSWRGAGSGRQVCELWDLAGPGTGSTGLEPILRGEGRLA